MRKTSALVCLLLMPLAARALENEAAPRLPSVTPVTENSLETHEPKVPSTSATSKFGPHDVEVRLRDGSAIRGELRTVDAVTIKTSFGTLKIPIEDLRFISHGKKGDAGCIAAAIADLKTSDAAKRKSAEDALDEEGNGVIDPLFDARSAATPELKSRIDTLLRKALSRTDAAAPAGDSVTSAKFEARGALQLETLDLSSKLGELKIKLSDVESVRWLAHGDALSLDLDAATAMRDWIDTGMELTGGDPVSILATGKINLFGNNVTTPEGNTNWDNQVFPIGALVAKLGSDGDAFLIAEGKSFKAERTQKLFLRMWCTDELLRSNGRQTNGRFNVRIATGSMIDQEAAKTETGKDPSEPKQ